MTHYFASVLGSVQNIVMFLVCILGALFILPQSIPPLIGKHNTLNSRFGAGMITMAGVLLLVGAYNIMFEREKTAPMILKALFIICVIGWFITTMREGETEAKERDKMRKMDDWSHDDDDLPF